MTALARLIRCQLKARQDSSLGEVLLLVGDEEYNAALASGRVARAARVIRIELVDPSDTCPLL